MQRLNDLFALFTSPDYKIRFLKAKSTSSCLACGRPAQPFREFSASFEYQISGLCEKCQDIYFRSTGNLCQHQVEHPLPKV
jgi:hypothetical protein